MKGRGEMKKIKCFKGLIVIILLLISNISFAESTQKMDKIMSLAVKYESELNGLVGEAQGNKALEILKEIRKLDLLNEFQNDKNEYIFSNVVFDYIWRYPNSNIKQLEHLLNRKIDIIYNAKDMGDDNLHDFSILGRPYLLYQSKNGIKVCDLGNRIQPQNLVGVIKKPIYTLVIADYDCNGSGCDPKIRLVSLIDDDFKDVYMGMS
jgi:hypothetical protein